MSDTEIIKYMMISLLIVALISGIFLSAIPTSHGTKKNKALRLFSSFFLLYLLTTLNSGFRIFPPYISNLLMYAGSFSLLLGFLIRFRVPQTKNLKAILGLQFSVFCLLQIIYHDVIFVRAVTTIVNLHLFAIGTAYVIYKYAAKDNLGDRFSFFASLIAIIGAPVLTLFAPTDGISVFYSSLYIYLLITVFMTLYGGILAAYLHDSVKENYLNSIKDPLTGLNNRRFFSEESTKRISQAERHQQPISLIMCDLDKFKNINDKYGHQVGDIILASFADLLKSKLRKEDVAARFGGEEFIILLPMTNQKQAVKVANIIKDSLEEASLEEDSGTLAYTASFGVAQVEDFSDIEVTIKHADESLYKAKENGRNRVECFSKS